VGVVVVVAGGGPPVAVLCRELRRTVGSVGWLVGWVVVVVVVEENVCDAMSCELL